MENSTINILLFFGIVVMWANYYLNKNKKDNQVIVPIKTEPEFIFDNTLTTSIEFLKDYIKIKFEFYLLNDFVAYSILEKEIPNSVLAEAKQKFYLDIATSLDEKYFDELGKIFTKPGLQLFIHQQFISLFNKHYLYSDGTKQKINKRIVDAALGE